MDTFDPANVQAEDRLTLLLSCDEPAESFYKKWRNAVNWIRRKCWKGGGSGDVGGLLCTAQHIVYVDNHVGLFLILKISYEDGVSIDLLIYKPTVYLVGYLVRDLWHLSRCFRKTTKHKLINIENHVFDFDVKYGVLPSCLSQDEFKGSVRRLYNQSNMKVKDSIDFLVVMLCESTRLENHFVSLGRKLKLGELYQLNDETKLSFSNYGRMCTSIILAKKFGMPWDKVSKKVSINKTLNIIDFRSCRKHIRLLIPVQERRVGSLKKDEDENNGGGGVDGGPRGGPRVGPRGGPRSLDEPDVMETKSEGRPADLSNQLCSAPELVGLLAELNDATKQLETYVNPLLSKVRKGKNDKKEALHYVEVKHVLLLLYCQAITFYLLLKSEGQSVHDHPVIARLVEIKGLLDKMKELDVHIPDGLENVLVEKGDIATAIKPIAKGNVLSSELFADLNELTRSSIEKQDSFKLRDKIESIQMQPTELDEKKRRMDKRQQDQQVSSESVKMLQHRAALEEKLKQKAGSVVPKTDNNLKQKQKKLTGKLETTDDFDDDVMDLEGTTHDVKRASTLSSKLSQIVPSKGNMLKSVSGDGDLPERDDLGERRWKHELRILSGAGIKLKDDDYDAQFEDELEKLHDGANAGDSDNDGGSDSGGSEDDYYNQIKRQKEAKRSLKAAKYSRNPQGLYEPETTADGKRHITTQMAKNKGLIRQRKKQNPRTRNKLKYAKATKRRAGQVREVKQPIHSYGGETTGINPNISRSNRF